MSASVVRSRQARRKTLPPSPPSPPSGPPRGMNFSRRKLRQPRPPLPAGAWVSTSSTNIWNQYTASGCRVRSAEPGLLGDGNNGDATAVFAVILEADLALDL